MKQLPLLLLMMLTTYCSQAQFNRYIVRFKDKNGSPYSINNPGAYLSQRSIDRRLRQQIPIDSTDLPVVQRYLDSIRLSGNVSLLHVSKWLNQVSFETLDAQALTRIQQLPFVVLLSPIAAKGTAIPVGTSGSQHSEPDANNGKTTDVPLDYGLSGAQIKIHRGDFLHRHGFKGEQLQIAIMDAGFYNYHTLPTFDSVRINGQILGTWDFVDNEISVSEDDRHGMHCFSSIAANLPGVFTGSAPKSSFYLFRTEDVGSEYPIEEHNFACAAEKADSAGVDLCSISLGYSTFSNSLFDYSYADMNGDKTISAIAADLAAKKGMLMTVAAGNEGNNSWRYVITPADADSVLAVGAVDTLGNVASFSSYGPSSDGQIKPTVVSVGRNAIVANSNTGLPNFGSGTSYACPNLAGLAACLWQAFPEVNNMTLIETIKTSGNTSDTPNVRSGYGLPDMKKAFVILQKKLSQRQARFSQCRGIVDLAIKTDSSMHIDLERKFPNQSYVPIHRFRSNQPYGEHQFQYQEDLAGTDYPYINYRFKVTIGSDTSYYLDSIQIMYANPCTNILPSADQVTIAPNPFHDRLEMKISTTSDADIRVFVFNEKGQKMLSNAFRQVAGTKNLVLNTAHLSNGIYFIQVMKGATQMSSLKAIRH